MTSVIVTTQLYDSITNKVYLKMSGLDLDERDIVRGVEINAKYTPEPNSSCYMIPFLFLAKINKKIKNRMRFCEKQSKKGILL